MHPSHLTTPQVQIVDYSPQYEKAFHDLNEEWISKYFRMEESDHKALDHAQAYILDKGGHILVALHQGEPVGVCALIKMDHPKYAYELAKMAVSPNVQGLGIGKDLAQAVLARARENGAKWVYLESNTVLASAIHLYRKLGFQEVKGIATPYERCNIQMEVEV
jgi:N-acetylglutamate synthase-like GNAT family acetyltransferase